MKESEVYAIILAYTVAEILGNQSEDTMCRIIRFAFIFYNLIRMQYDQLKASVV